MPALATYEQAVSPENVAKVSLTGLSFYRLDAFYKGLPEAAAVKEIKATLEARG